jgi:hypothetical protein
MRPICEASGRMSEKCNDLAVLSEVVEQARRGCLVSCVAMAMCGLTGIYAE